MSLQTVSRDEDSRSRPGAAGSKEEIAKGTIRAYELTRKQGETAWGTTSCSTRWASLPGQATGHMMSRWFDSAVVLSMATASTRAFSHVGTHEIPIGPGLGVIEEGAAATAAGLKQSVENWRDRDPSRISNSS